jgi:biopolymer transport protein ExbB/TolQ
LEDLLNRLTDDKELKTLYHQYLTDADKETKKLRLNAAIEAHPDSDRLRVAEDEATIRLLQHMKQTNSFLQNFLQEARAAVAQPA